MIRKSFSKFFLAILIMILSVTACQKELIEPEIHYYISLKPNSSPKYDELKVNLVYIRAFQEYENEGEYGRTVFNDGQNLNFSSNSLNTPVYLGNSNVNPDNIIGFDFYFNNASVEIDNDSMSIQSIVTKSTTYIELDYEKVVNVFFEIDLDSSIVETSTNVFKFLPKISVSHEFE